jgi:hypothetical protein
MLRQDLESSTASAQMLVQQLQEQEQRHAKGSLEQTDSDGVVNAAGVGAGAADASNTDEDINATADGGHASKGDFKSLAAQYDELLKAHQSEVEAHESERAVHQSEMEAMAKRGARLEREAATAERVLAEHRQQQQLHEQVKQEQQEQQQQEQQLQVILEDEERQEAAAGSDDVGDVGAGGGGGKEEEAAVLLKERCDAAEAKSIELKEEVIHSDMCSLTVSLRRVHRYPHLVRSRVLPLPSKPTSKRLKALVR